MRIIHYSRCSKILNTSWQVKRSRQTVQTEIRLVLKKKSNLGLLGNTFVNSSPDSQPFVCKQKENHRPIDKSV